MTLAVAGLLAVVALGVATFAAQGAAIARDTRWRVEHGAWRRDAVPAEPGPRRAAPQVAALRRKHIPASKDDEHARTPWFSMWTAPRATIRQLVQTDPEHGVLQLAALGGVAQVFGAALAGKCGAQWDWPAIVVCFAVLGPILGVLSLYVSGALLHWTGCWLGGTASAAEVRCAVAWSAVPNLWLLPVRVLVLALFGREMFTCASPQIEADPILRVIYLMFGLVNLLVAVWSFLVLLKSVGEVQGFSAWAALGNVLLAFVTIVIGVVALGVALVVFMLLVGMALGK